MLGRGTALSFGDEFVEVVGLRRGQLAHREVVEDEQVGEDAAGLGEADVGALADGLVAEGLGGGRLRGGVGVEAVQGGLLLELGCVGAVRA